MWRQPNAAYSASNINENIPFRGGSVMCGGCVSYDCKLVLVTVQGDRNGPRYQRDVLETVVVPHFDNHASATRPVCMDDNAGHTHTHTHTHTQTHTHTIERVQWWISYSETQSLPFIGRHEAPTSIHLRTIEAFLVDECVRDILQSNI